MKYSSKVAALCISAAFATGFAFADGDIPTVTEVSMQQGPGNRIVTIKYKLDSYPAVVTLDVMTNDTVSIGGAAVCNAQGAVWRKVTSADADGSGWCTITWDPTQSWKDGNGNGFRAQDVKAEVTAWPLDNTPDYMAVDLTATGGADTQNYYPAADFVPSGVTNDIYKTSMLLMRKIMAKDVRWTMGSVTETQRDTNSENPHQVVLANNYYIGVYEVTQTQWYRIMDQKPSYFTYADDFGTRPVEKVSHKEVRDNGNSSYYWPASPYSGSFLYKLRSATGIADFDLPSEAQWEFAARAGNGDAKWGDGSGILGTAADANLNLLGRYKHSTDIIVAPGSTASETPASTPAADGGTAKVGSKEPNDWGLYDMAGNVWELCLDWYQQDITALNGGVNTTVASKRIKRGGCWFNDTFRCRPAWREQGSPNWVDGTTGFRVVCTAGLQ